MVSSTSDTQPREGREAVLDGTTPPLPPAALGNTAASWLVSRDDMGKAVLLGDEFTGPVAVVAKEAA